jgi:hypothetical protein
MRPAAGTVSVLIQVLECGGEVVERAEHAAFHAPALQFGGPPLD